jgi:ribosomal protein L40E
VFPSVRKEGREMTVCPECNTLNDNDARFCNKCGRSLESRSLIPVTTTESLRDAERRNSLVAYQTCALAVEQLADFMDELKSKAALDPAKIECQCFEITNTTGSIEKVCYFSQRGQNDWSLSLELLTKRLTAAFLPPPTVPALMQGRTEPSVPGEGLFVHLAPLLGFSNFVPSGEDRANNLAATYCRDTFKRLHESATLSEEDWQQLRQAAAERAHGRLIVRISGLDPYSQYNSLPYTWSYQLFSYSRSYSNDDLRNGTASHLVTQIVAGEDRRLAAFLTALHNTLLVLPAVGAMRHDQGIAPPEDTEQMIDFLYLLHSVLTGTVGQEALLSPLPAFGAVTVVNSEPIAKDKVAVLERQVQVKEEELAQTKDKTEQRAQTAVVELHIANQQIEELKEQLAFLKPQVMSEKALESYYDYKRRLQEAASRERVNGVRPQLEIDLHRGNVETLIYSFDPSAVAFSLRELDAMEAGKRRAISNKAFLHFAGVLGYYNLYQYLLQARPDLLPMLCNLAVLGSQIVPLMSNLDAVSWVTVNLPPEGNLLGSPCWYTFKGTRHTSSFSDLTWKYREEEDRVVAQAILQFEKHNLLDFRQSLSIAASLFAPALPEERDQQEESFPPSQAVPYAVPPPFSDRRVRIAQETHDSALHRHHYFIEINDQANGISQPIEVDFVVDDAGTIIPPPEEEEA